MEHNALANVENVCQREVDLLCRPREEMMSNPIMNWMMTPERLAPPMIHPAALEPTDPINLGPLLDHMLDTALNMPFIMQPQEPMFFLIIDLDQEEDSPRAPEEHALDAMLSKLVQQTNQEQPAVEETKEEVHDVIHHIRLKGQQVLEQEDVPEDRRRLARRLTEVTPEEMMKMRQYQQSHTGGHVDYPHHMCPRKQQCLMAALEQNQVSRDCANALTRLEVIRRAEFQKMQETEVYMSLFWLYCALFLVLFSMVMARKIKSGRGLFRLRLRILQAIYSNPELKAKVEDEVGESLGAVPPLSTAALKFLSADGPMQLRRKRERFINMLYLCLALLALDAFGVLPPIWPLVVMGFCCCYLVSRMVILCFSKPEVRECKCCCCGGSTTDVENGTVSASQACCNCCKGTGVCSAKCKTCCGPSDGDACSCCGGKDCCCCDGDSKKACPLKEKLLKESSDCTCCCCGGSTLDVERGTVSEMQACCCCCKGTGVCSPACKDCCGPKVLSAGPRIVVYQGVPLQIV